MIIIIKRIKLIIIIIIIITTITTTIIMMIIFSTWDNMSLVVPESIVVVSSKTKRKKEKKEKKKKKKKSKSRSSKKIALIDEDRKVNKIEGKKVSAKKKKDTIIGTNQDIIDVNNNTVENFAKKEGNVNKDGKEDLNRNNIEEDNLMLDITSKEDIEIIDQPVDNNSPIKLNIEKIEIEEEFDESLDNIEKDNSVMDFTEEFENDEMAHNSDKNEKLVINDDNIAEGNQDKSIEKEEKIIMDQVAITETETNEVTEIHQLNETEPVLRMDTYSDEDLEGLANEIYVGDIEYHTGHESSDVTQHSPIHSAKSNVSSRSNSNSNDKDVSENMMNLQLNFPTNLTTIIDDSPPRLIKSSPQPEFADDYQNGEGALITVF